MEIVRTNTEDKVTLYKLTQDAGIRKMTDIKGDIKTVKAYAQYTDEDKDGNVREIVSIMGEDDVVHATNSPTFIRDFLKMVDLFGDELKSINVVAGTSKANREFITASLGEVKVSKKK